MYIHIHSTVLVQYVLNKHICTKKVPSNDHRSHIHKLVKLMTGKNSGLNSIRTHDLCDTGVVLYQLTYQANLELVTLEVIHP